MLKAANKMKKTIAASPSPAVSLIGKQIRALAPQKPAMTRQLAIGLFCMGPNIGAVDSLRKGEAA